MAGKKKPASTPKSKAVVKFITVRVGKLPGVIQQVALNGGRTVADALEGAGLAVEDYEVRVNGRLSTLDTKLTAGQTVLLLKQITGN